MRKLDTENTAGTRCVNLTGLQDYLTLGRNSAEKIAAAAGAKFKIGARTLYDLKKIDAYIDAMQDKEGIAV